ncbi:LamG-like jellyroll fold domain-containing protein [Chitinophaga lutea]
MKKIIPFCLMALTLACNKEGAAPEQPDYTNDIGKLPGRPKVLYLVVDGARGLSVRDLKPPTIWKMRDSAVYSWNGISDSLLTDGGNWANLLTGVKAVKHGIQGNDYTNANLTQYPVVFQRIREARPDIRTMAATASADLSGKIIGNTVTENKPAGNDAAVKDAIIAELQKDDAAVVFGQFNGVAQAGAQGGYDISVPAYRDALLRVDGYVADIMKAVYARKTYADERWLVVLTSSRGGAWTQDPEDSTVMGNPKMNTFTLFFNNRFQSKVIVKPQDLRVPFEGKAVRLTGDVAGTAIRARAADATIGDMNTLKGMTIECKVKLNKGPNGNYRFSHPPFLSKTANRSGSTLGWALFKNDQGVVFYLSDGVTNLQAPNNAGQGGKNTDDGNWHTFTAVVDRVGNTYYVGVFVDGANKVSRTWTGTTDIKSTTPLTVGFNPTTFGNAFDGYITDVKIWNVAIPDEIVKLWAPRTYINKDHIYYDNLIGYWPCMDGAGNRFKDYGPQKKDLLLEGAWQWSQFSDMSTFLLPGISDGTKYVPNTLDIPYQVLEWLGIRREDSWNLDGHAWPAEFRDFPVFLN